MNRESASLTVGMRARHVEGTGGVTSPARRCDRAGRGWAAPPVDRGGEIRYLGARIIIRERGDEAGERSTRNRVDIGSRSCKGLMVHGRDAARADGNAVAVVESDTDGVA